MKQTVKDKARQTKLLRTTGRSSVDRKKKLDNMTSYLEDNSIVATAPKAAELTEQEKETALKAIKYYKSLSYTEIDQLLLQSEERAERRKRDNKNMIKYAILAIAAVAIAAVIFIIAY